MAVPKQPHNSIIGVPSYSVPMTPTQANDVFLRHEFSDILRTTASDGHNLSPRNLLDMFNDEDDDERQ